MGQAIVQVLIVVLFTGLVGIILMIVRDIFQNDHYPSDNRLERTPTSEPSNGEEPYERLSRQSKATA